VGALRHAKKITQLPTALKNEKDTINDRQQPPCLLFLSLFYYTTMFSSKSVSFGDVQVREFPMILGDNPACSSGAPVSIDWDHVDEFTLTVNDAKSARSGRSKKTISVTKRAQMLMGSGYSIEDIAEAVLLIEEIKMNRFESSNSTNLGDRVHVLLKNTGKLPKGLMKGVLKLTKTKQNSLRARSA
jgi:hypothetical protein